MEKKSRMREEKQVKRQEGNEAGSESPNIDPFVPRKDFYDPRELRSWAKKTGFVSTAFSVEATTSSKSNEIQKKQRNSEDGVVDLEEGVRKTESLSPTIEIDPVLGRTKRREFEIEPNSRAGSVRSGNERERNRGKFEPLLGVGNEERKDSLDDTWEDSGLNGNIARTEPKNENLNGAQVDVAVPEPNKDGGDAQRGMPDDYYPGGDDGGYGGQNASPRMICGMREKPGYVLLTWYGLQHYLSLAGSLIFIPLVMVPTMGGTDKDTATVISTMLLVSGVTTILHSLFGTRLPLVQGGSFVYLAPALVIMNSQDFRNLTEHKFKHIMRELQGAIIVGSLFQCILGFTGLMSLILRLINPVVVAPTVAAVGLAFFAYGFPQAGSCVEISLPQIVLILIFTLYLRGVSVFGHKVFRIYAVPMSVVIIWTYAFFLTAGGAYNFKGCSPDIPSSNIILSACVRHASTMKHCRTDVSDAMRTSAWLRIPYPFQWGIPIFRLRTSIIMIIVSLVASVDSIGTYHSSSMRINLKPPTPGIVSRGIGMEGFCSILAGIWGSGTGSTTLTENVQTIEVTKVANRRALIIGAVFLILFSLVGKVGAILASIPQALAAAVLCYIWALIVTLGLSILQYTQTASSRNITIIGVSIFLGLSVPAYFQQYDPKSSLILPSYLVPYGAASAGPVHTGSKQLDFAVNGLMSLNMVVAFLVAIILDNTVPGSRQERGVYMWSTPEDVTTDPSAYTDYTLPGKVGKFFRWAKCLGV
ncbi:transporter [Lithospermum erythrorhizon]|uniref:Transporter n=1 Tax=Lithospermum erythrorhizon TaxID=34254 RepID=A0AAV3RE91_LITER